MARASHILAAAFAAAFSTTGAQAADALYGGGPEFQGPCAEQRYLARITRGFGHQVRNVPNLPDVAITDFRDIHENRYIPDDPDNPMARRYCGATVVLSDGNSRDLWYLIESRMGFAGMGDNVEFCVSGFDRWYVYNGRCRILR